MAQNKNGFFVVFSKGCVTEPRPYCGFISDLILQYQKYLCLTLITTVQMILLYTHCLNRVYYIRKCFVLLFIVDAHRFKSRNFNLVRYKQNVKYYENYKSN